MYLLIDSSATAGVESPTAIEANARVRMVAFIVHGDWDQCVGLSPDFGYWFCGSGENSARSLDPCRGLRIGADIRWSGECFRLNDVPSLAPAGSPLSMSKKRNQIEYHCRYLGIHIPKLDLPNLQTPPADPPPL